MNELVRQSGALIDMPPVKQVAKTELFQAVNAAIGKSFADAGVKMLDDNDRDYLVNQVVKDIQTYTPNLRLEEIGIAFQNGVRGKYGDYFGLNVVTFNKFLVAYLSSGERDQRILKEADPEPEPAPPAPEEYDQRCMGHLKDAFKIVSEGGFFEDFGNFLYTWLDKEKGVIKLSKERRWKIWEEAETKLLLEKEEEKNAATDYLKRKQISLIIEKIQAKSKNDLVEIKAKKIALNTWIKDQIEFGGTPESIFNNE
ncbi:MAG TPA: hypothetical protein VD907_06800 [Verrucomicrobiae bacterium]|nr:hypothetical protein [Verrucomicrobiae bacterium]